MEEKIEKEKDGTPGETAGEMISGEKGKNPGGSFRMGFIGGFLTGLLFLAVLAGGCGYCRACFHGDYPTAVPTDTRKNRFEKKLSDAVAVETLGNRHPGFL